MTQQIYEKYVDFKNYQTPVLSAKHIQQFNFDFWIPSDCSSLDTVLELGCGTGQFLHYLKHKNVQEFLGIDQDPNLKEFIPKEVANNFKIQKIEEFLKEKSWQKYFSKIVLFDVLEHFSYSEGEDLLKAIKPLLTDNGKVILKTPNMSSPWGGQYQFGDLTHLAAYTPSSIRQLAILAGYQIPNIHPQMSGSPIRRIADPMIHKILSKLLMTPPEIWTANFITILEKQAST